MALIGCRDQRLSDGQNAVRRQYVADMFCRYGVEFDVDSNGRSCYYIPLVDLGR